MIDIGEEKTTQHACPNCGERQLVVFYEIHDVPVNSVILLWTREEALNCPKGDVVLGFCQNCKFVTNLAFDPGKLEYSSKYESTQAFSSTFNAFHQQLALSLIERYDLNGKRVIEIGCGQGEFLTLLAELGDNYGIGFDPVFNPERGPKSEKIEFIKDFYSEKYADYQADFVCCKMTLEHIRDTAVFVNMVHKTTSQNKDTIIFFQVPNARYVFSDLAFWDIYYEHCSYFTQHSMSHLFHQAGFDVLNTWTEYDDQYLMIEAKTAVHRNTRPLMEKEHDSSMSQIVSRFAASYRHVLDEWRQKLEQMQRDNLRVVLWGGGSKTVSFLNTLGLTNDTIKYAVDINPNKTGTFLAGTGQEVVAPGFLQDYKPDTVIIMNPVYKNEISKDLKQKGLSPHLMTV